MNNGAVGVGENRHSRWCSSCVQYHGILYNCPSYPQELLEMLKKSEENFREYLRTLPL